MSNTSLQRICVLGNCHAAALKIGWQRLEEEYPGVALTFFADRGKGMKNLQAEDGFLCPKTDNLRSAITHTSGGLGFIDPGEYDCFLIVGLGFKFPSVFGRLQCQQHLSAAVEALSWAAYSRRHRRSSAYSIVMKVRSLTSKPVFLGHDPLRAARPDSPSDSAGVESETGNRYYEQCMQKMVHILYKESDICLVPQPDETLSGILYTDRKYTLESTRLGVGKKTDGETHSAEDNFHMNGDYGEIYLRKFLDDRLSA